MADFKLKWDPIGERYYETGVDRGVVYAQEGGAYVKGEAWNGLSGVTLSPEGAEANPFYANNKKYLNIMSSEDMKFSIEAYTYPDTFAVCCGEVDMVPGVRITQQTRKPFGFTCRNILGNDTEFNDYGYVIHLLYGCMAAPVEKARPTVNDSVEIEPMSWEVTTTPVDVPNYKPTAHLEINSTTVDPAKLAAFEAILYGSGEEDARLPLPAEVAELLSTEAAG